MILSNNLKKNVFTFLSFHLSSNHLTVCVFIQRIYLTFGKKAFQINNPLHTQGKKALTNISVLCCTGQINSWSRPELPDRNKRCPLAGMLLTFFGFPFLHQKMFPIGHVQTRTHTHTHACRMPFGVPATCSKKEFQRKSTVGEPGGGGWRQKGRGRVEGDSMENTARSRCTL